MLIIYDITQCNFCVLQLKNISDRNCYKKFKL